MQQCLLLPQLHDLRDQRPVVVRAIVLAARGPGAPRLLAQVAPLREGEEGQDRGARQGDGVALRHAALGGRGAGRREDELGQPRQLGFVLQHQLPFGFVVQHVLAERGGQPGQLLRHFHVARLRIAAQQRAGPHEVEVHPLEQALLFGRERQSLALFVQGPDPLEQPSVHVDAALVCRQRNGHPPLHRLQLGRGLGGAKVVEKGLHAGEQAAAAVEGGQRVVEAGWLRVGGDGVEFRQVFAHRGFEGRLEMRGLHLVERRQAVRRGPRLQQGIGVGHPRILRRHHAAVFRSRRTA